MIIFHEGLPGSGKSYEAMKMHVVPALQKGRKVFGYIDGVDDPACRAKVAEVTGLTQERVDELWRPIRAEDLERLPELVEDNSFVVIDEVQDHWPAGRKALSKPLTTFVTQHRHRGIDVLLMGQLLKDVNALWRGRVDQRCVFNKLDSLGSAGEKRYSINVQKATAPEKFQSVVKSVGKYDPSLFGMYKSVTSDAVSTVTYRDKRATVWAGAGMRIGLPAMAVVGVVAFWQAWKYFHPVPVVPGAAAPAQVQVRAPGEPGQGTAPGTAAPRALPPPSTLADAIQLWSSRYRARLNVIAWETPGGVRYERGAIEWYDDQERIQERQTFEQLRRSGVSLRVVEGSAIVAGVVVTAWRPREPVRRPYGAEAATGLQSTSATPAGAGG